MKHTPPWNSEISVRRDIERVISVHVVERMERDISDLSSKAEIR